MVRVRAGESFKEAVERERKRRRGLSEAAPNPKEGITAKATNTSAGVSNETKERSGEQEGRPPQRRRRRGLSRGCRLDGIELLWAAVAGSEGTSSGSYGPPMPPVRERTEGDGVPRGSKASGSCGPEMPPPGMRMEGRPGVPKKSKVSGSYGPATPPLEVQTDGAAVSHNSKGSGSCAPAMPPREMQTEGAGVPDKSKGSGSYGPAMPPLEVRTDGAGVSKNSKGSGSSGTAMPPPEMQTEGAGVPDKSKGSGSCGRAMPPPGMRTEGGPGVPMKSKGSDSCGPATPPPRVRPDGAGVLELTVEETDALDCGVCFLPLKTPIFQCNNGHAVCSLCHDKLKATGKCHVCGVTTDGNRRCHVMERLAESIRFLCPNAAYGCTARLVYHDREGHWQKCPHSPCCCPAKACGFISPMELLLDHFASVHGWPLFTTALANGHFTVSLRDGFNFLRADDQASSSPGILFVLNVVRSPLGCAISMFCIDTHADNNGQEQFSKEPVECELTYLRHVSSRSRRTGDQLTEHYQRCKFRVALTDLSNGLPTTNYCFQLVLPNFALGEENKETVQVQGQIFIS